MLFSFSFVSWGQIFGVFFAPFPEEEISDYIAHGPIIRVLTVLSGYLIAHTYADLSVESGLSMSLNGFPRNRYCTVGSRSRDHRIPGKTT